MKKSLFAPLSLLVLCLLASLPAFGQAGLIISQIYGGGGNSSATYNADFVELYNPTSAAISTAGLSIQYASAAGNFTQAAVLSTATIPAGRFFLVQTIPAGTTGTSLPTPDTVATSPNLAAAAGKVALVNGTTALSGDTTCALILADTRILDFVGYGSTASCYPGSGSGTSYAPGPANNATSLARSSLSAGTGDNSRDFALIPVNPRNSAYGAPVGALSATGSASPTSVTAGQSVLLTVTVTPGTVPASTGITVTGDLRLIGGSQTQAFTAAGNNTFTYTATVTSGASGVQTLPISVADGQARTASASIGVTVSQPVATVAIDVIQGQKSTTALRLSPYAGQRVTTSGIVTAIIPAAFFIQTPDALKDGDPLTPEGIQVFYGTGSVPTNVVLGAAVTVTGTVATYPTLTTATVSGSSTPATEITTPTTVVNSTGNPLPAAITLTTAMLTPSGGLFQLTPYEGMRVAIPSLTTTSGTGGSLAEATETITTDGTFYAVIGNTPRPFREPGIDLRDIVVDATKQTAVFDDNPERILVDSDLAGGTSIELSTGAVLANVTGVLDFTYSNDSFYDPSRLILDAAYDRTQVTPGMTVQPVPAKAANEFTVVSYNIERFFNTLASDDIYKTTALASLAAQHPDLTQAAYTRRLQKVSLAVRTVLNLPDVVTLEEVENQSVANDIANQINTDAGIPNLYTGISTDNTTYFTQDGTGISVGFLVKNTVDTLSFSQYGYGESFTPTGAGSAITLNDRPWMVLNAGIKRAGATDYPVTVIANHMKSLININSTTSSSTRQKKELQAEDIARYIQGLQASGKHVISGGDFNAFEFSDGYTDTLGTYTNVNVLPANQVVQPGVAGLATPPLVNLALTLPVAQRWSYQEDGSAQILDQMVVTPELVAAGAHLAYAHMNADFPESATNDATTAARNSDHDPAVGYFILPAPVLSATLTPASANFGSGNTVGATSAGQGFTFTNTGEGTISVTSITASGDYAASNNCGGSVALTSSCAINVVLTPTAPGTRTGTLTVVSSAGTYTSTLTATVAAVALPTLSPASLTFAATPIGLATAPQVVTVTNRAAIAVPVASVAVSGNFSQVNTCGSSIAAGGTCAVSIAFAPTGAGTRAGTLTMTTTGLAATTLTASLTGTGQAADFMLTDAGGGTSTAATVPAGTAAGVKLTFTPVLGTPSVIGLTCAAQGTAPTGVSCVVPGAFSIGGTAAVTQTVTLATTARTAATGFAGWTPWLALAGFGMLLAGRAGRMRGRLGRVAGLLMVLVAVCLPMAGCGSGAASTTTNTGSSTTNPNGTPAGTYTYVITATSSTGAVHTETVALTVQ